MTAHGFRNYFTTLPGYFSPFPHGTRPLSVTHSYLDLPHGRGGFTRDSTSPTLLGNATRQAVRLRLRGHHPLRQRIQPLSAHTRLYHCPTPLQEGAAASHNTGRATAGAYHTRPVWSAPLSLATTHGISFPAGTEMFHFPAYPPPQRRCQPQAGGFPHSDTLGSKPSRRLPEAYRGPTRLSSAMRAQASTMSLSKQINATPKHSQPINPDNTNHHNKSNDHTKLKHPNKNHGETHRGT